MIKVHWFRRVIKETPCIYIRMVEVSDFDKFLMSFTGDYFSIENRLKYHGIRFMLVAYFSKSAGSTQNSITISEKLKTLRSALQLDSKSCFLAKDVDLDVYDK